MNTEEITVVVVDEWDAEDIVALYCSAGWWDGDADAASVILPLFKGSYAVVVAHDKDNKAVGMGRLISDGVADAYIQDVVVNPRCRGQGIGKRIVQLLVDTCHEAGITWIALIAEPGTHTFYTPLGFMPMDNHLPMKYEGVKENNDHP
ncbi:GNAT family N-acetyltransferase [Methanogenium marinum]|uniref:GNAT family N-acetyltransferase n=1 Tax=Methanogenium marinum TaxID=348610 RepID=A0A9Q4KSM7_9EURY|nr:GNAT family N-acetyltransferase [Methanogenium marinum]MDE4907237.1 GNAT family N-acetyltransferase [Methanogenium marinum]